MGFGGWVNGCLRWKGTRRPGSGIGGCAIGGGIDYGESGAFDTHAHPVAGDGVVAVCFKVGVPFQSGILHVR